MRTVGRVNIATTSKGDDTKNLPADLTRKRRENFPPNFGLAAIVGLTRQMRKPDSGSFPALVLPPQPAQAVGGFLH
jgi:hypothetical protein